MFTLGNWKLPVSKNSKKNCGCGILVFLFGSYSRSVIRAKAHTHLLDVPTLLEVHKQRGNTCGNE